MSAEVHPKAPSSESLRVRHAARARQALLLAAGLLAAAASLAFACGGTTGMPDQGATPGVPITDGGADATVPSSLEASAPIPDAGLFDVEILYADQVLPDVSTPAEGGAAGYPWPNCPPFLPVDVDGVPTTIGNADHESAAAYNDAGAVVLAPDGSPCASYPWLGSLAIDQCVTGTPPLVTWSVYNDVVLPPCNWCVEAGVAAQGSRSQDSRYQICLALYSCIISSGCGSQPNTCLCGSETSSKCAADPNPPGPCAAQEMAALEEIPGSTNDALAHYEAWSPTFLGQCGSRLNSVFGFGLSNQCFADGGQ